jgi:hypothetical protein
MSLADYNETIFGLKLDEKKDTIIYEYRKFFGNENRGESSIAIKLRSNEALDYVKNIRWIKCQKATIDTTGNFGRAQIPSKVLIFDQDKQLVRIAFGNGIYQEIFLSRMLKRIRLEDLYYSIEIRKTEFEFSEKGIFLFDKKKNILYLSFSNE